MKRPIISINQLSEKLQKRLKLQPRLGAEGREEQRAPSNPGCQGKLIPLVAEDF